jgi:hypothetical protein
MIRLSSAFSLFLFFTASLYHHAAAQPRVFSCDGAAIVRARDAYKTGSPNLTSALDQLRKDADAALSVPIHSVMDKQQIPPGGNRHDYMSLARYYWPDTTKPNGLPYVSRDGVVNPEILSITDATYFATMAETAQTLALAAFIFGEERFAARAAQIIRVWFLDTATAMNPNLEHAQAVKGMDDGRPAGTIETRNIGLVFDAAGLLAGAESWTAADQDGLMKWSRDYLRWLTTSRRAIAASNFENNISIWFAVQAGSVALFVDDRDAAVRIFLKARTLAVDRQIEPGGEQPRELARTISAHYVLFNIEAFFRLAELAEHAGVDLWTYRSPDGRSIRGSLDWIVPYVRGEKTWTWKQIKKFDWGTSYYQLLQQASSKFNDPEYGRLARRASGETRTADRVHLLYNTIL